MAFTQPTMATNNVSLLDNNPNDNTGLTADQLKAVFDKFGVDAKAFLINLLSELQSTTTGSSGADNIGSSPISGVEGNTVHAQIVSLLSQVLTLTNTMAYTPTSSYHPSTKKYVDDVVAGVILGQISDGSLTDAKLSNDPTAIKARVAAKSDQTYVDNQLSLKAANTDNSRTTTAKDVTGAINELNANKTENKDYVRCPAYGTTAGTSTAYTVSTTPAPSSYVDGMQITIVPNVDCGLNPTLNWNGLGALTIVNQNGSSVYPLDIKAGKPITLVRIGINFFIRNVGGNIRSIQTGIANLTTQTTYNIAISSVSTTSSIVRVWTRGNSPFNTNTDSVSADITNSTQVTLSRNSGSTGVTVYWEVVEFNNVKSIQTGTKVVANYTSGDVVTVSSINSSKSQLFCSVYDNVLNNSSFGYSEVLYRIESSTSIRLWGYGTSQTIHYQLIEFA